MRLQYIGAAVLAIVLVLVGVIVATGGKIDIPGVSRNMAEVTVKVERGWGGGMGCAITNVQVYRGMEMFSLGPFIFEADWKVEVTATYGNRIVGTAQKVVTIHWGQTVYPVLQVPIGENVSGTMITARVMDIANNTITAGPTQYTITWEG